MQPLKGNTLTVRRFTKTAKSVNTAVILKRQTHFCTGYSPQSRGISMSLDNMNGIVRYTFAQRGATWGKSHISDLGESGIHGACPRSLLIALCLSASLRW